MPNIAQQDYIIIDWEGKDDSDAVKKAEVDAQLKNIYLANPLALLSVIFKDFGVGANYSPYMSQVIEFGVNKLANACYLYHNSSDEGILEYQFKFAE